MDILNMVQAAAERLPERTRANLGLRLFAITQVPMILVCTPTVEVLTDDVCAVRIPLNRVTRNHFKSMYFGALAVGADVTAGLLAQFQVLKTRKKIGFLFKSLDAQFLRRPESDVLFSCDQGLMVKDLVRRAVETGARVEEVVKVVATTPGVGPATPVAVFNLELSLKLKSKRRK